MALLSVNPNMSLGGSPIDQLCATYSVTNQLLPNHQAGRDKAQSESIYLEGKIRSFFRKDVATRPGFHHLADIEVTVLSGDYLADECDQQKKLTF